MGRAGAQPRSEIADSIIRGQPEPLKKVTAD
jgi:hypothetical protein